MATGIADLAIVGGTVLPMVRNARDTIEATVLVHEGRIVGLTKDRTPEAREVIDARGGIVMPGFVDAHCHAIHLLMRGLSDGLTYHEWLEKLMYVALPHYTEADARVAAQLFCVEAIRSGITTVGDSTDFGNRADLVRATLRAFDEAGLRATYFRNFSDAPPPALAGNREDADSALRAIAGLAARWRSRGSRIRIGAGINEPHFSTASALQRTLGLADRADLRVMAHVAEVEADAVIDGRPVVDWLDGLGVLSPRLVLAHCVWLKPRHFRKLAARGAGVTWQPSTNAFLADGVMPLRDALAAGVAVGLGTDDTNASDQVSMFTEMRTAALVTKLRERDGTAVSAGTLLALATRGGARVLGLGNEIGMIAPGCAADLIVIDRAALGPAHDFASALVYQARGGEVRTVVIDGRVVMRDGVLTTLDEADIRARAMRAAAALARRSGVRPVRSADAPADFLFRSR